MMKKWDKHESPRTDQREFRLRASIGNMERPVCVHPTELRLINVNLETAVWDVTKMRSRQHVVGLAESQHYIIYATDARSTFHDRVEHRLYIRRRPADDAQHLGRCSLVLQCFAQFRVALLQFFE